MSDNYADPKLYRRYARELEVNSPDAAKTLRDAAQAIDDARATSHERRPTVSDQTYVMPSAQALKEANAVIHEARMALYNDDDAITKRFLPIPGWEYVSPIHLVHKGLDAGHEALWLLYCAVHQEELEQAKVTP